MEEGRHETTPSGRMKWNYIKPKLLSSLSKSDISNDMDGSEDHLVYMNDSCDESLEFFHEFSIDEFLGLEDE